MCFLIPLQSCLRVDFSFGQFVIRLFSCFSLHVASQHALRLGILTAVFGGSLVGLIQSICTVSAVQMGIEAT